MLKVVLTGGPSSGKTSVLNRMKEEFSEQGYNTIVIPETATDLIMSGIRPFGNSAVDLVPFQNLVLDTQISKEKVAEAAAKEIGEDKTIIICDRGTLDGYAYVTDEEWMQILARKGLDKRKLLNEYDAIIYLESAEKFFTKENNEARYESDSDEAIKKGNRTLESYLTHNELHVIKPREKFEDKINEVIGVMHSLLDTPIPIKTQRKFLVDEIDVDKLQIKPARVEIEQVYLDGLRKEDEQHRIRKVIDGKSVSYHYTVMKKEENGKRVILREQIITEGEYELLSMFKSLDCGIIKKVRYSFVYNNQYYKLDVFDDGLMLLELDVTKENPEIKIPEFISVIDEVTNNEEYQNIAISRKKETSYGQGQNYCYRRN